MGGATSRFEETDWTKANGRLIAQEDEKDHPTIDGSSPTRSYRIYEIIKQSKMTSQREFEVIDPKKRHVLYITRPVQGTLAWFDVINPNLSTSSQLVGNDGYDDYILRVETDLSRRTWMVYRYHTPVFEGQRPATMKVRKGLGENVRLYKAACITVSWSRYTAVVARYRPPSLEDVLEIEAEGEGGKNHNSGNQEGSINDSMSPSKRISSLIGTPTNSSNTPTSAAARVASMFRSSTSFRSNGTTDEFDDDEDNDDDMMAQAAKIAASRRIISVETSSTTTTESTSAIAKSPSERLARNRERVEQALKKRNNSNDTLNGDNDDSTDTSSIRNPTSFDSLSEYIKRQPAGTSMSSEDDNTLDLGTTTTTPTGSATKLREMFQTKSKSISSRLFGATATADEEGKEDDISNKYNESGGGGDNKMDSAREDKRISIKDRSSIRKDGMSKRSSSNFLSQSERNVARRQTALEKAMEGIIDLGKNSSGDTNDNDSSGASATLQNGGTKHIIDYDDDDPSAAPPALLQVEEIYNKLIGTHQTSYVTRDQVLQMLATEEAQQQQKKGIRGKLSPAANANNNQSGTTDATTNTATTTVRSGSSNPLIKAVESQGNGNNNAAATTPTRKRDSWLGFGLISRSMSSVDDASVRSTPSNAITEESTSKETVNSNNEDEQEKKNPRAQLLQDEDEEQLMTLDDVIPGGLQSLLDDDIPTITSPTSFASSTGSGSPSKGRRTSTASSSTGTITPTKSPNKDSSSANNSSSPLVGYWTWKNTYKVHKMRLHLAKNSDLAMHVVLAILVNQVRYERNALAMTV